VRWVEADAFERPVALRLPFRFGAATVRAARQVFARVTLEDVAGRCATGWAADLMVPKWFDKRPDRSHEENVADLRSSVHAALTAARSAAPAATLFDRARACRQALAIDAEPNPLLAGFGPALVERAAIDALGRLLSLSFPSLLRAGALGFEVDDEPLGIDDGAFFRRLSLPAHVALRHTVGLVDPIEAADVAERPDDDLPVALAEVLEAQRPRWLKVKLAGDADLDLARLGRVTALLARSGFAGGITLDGNEQLVSIDAALAFWDALERDPVLAQLRPRIAYLEQPFSREQALADDVRPLAHRIPLVLDEGDGRDDAFRRARDRGWSGVSVKSCKGVFRALRNALRCAAWNGGNPSGCPYFLSGEDLTAQAGLAVQQDLALAAVLGVAHVERNGHHYAGGLQGARPAEVERFLAAHPDLYAASGAGGLRLRIDDGTLAVGSLDCPGFASGAHPDPAAMTPLGGDG
jgi:hypothetical protein